MDKNKLLDDLFDKMLLVSKNMLTSLEEESVTLGYNKTEYLIISDIIEHQYTTAQEISERTGIKKSALSRALNPLIDKGVIAKNQCAEDRRESKLLVENSQTLNQFCKASLLSRMFTSCPKSDQDLIDIDEQLEKLIGIMSK